MNTDGNVTFHAFDVGTKLETGEMQLSAKASRSDTKTPAPWCNVAAAITPEMLMTIAPSGRPLHESLSDISWLLRQLSVGDPTQEPIYNEDGV